MRVLSLFDGMSCAMLALMDAGVNVSRYVAYEIDKYAVQTSSHNFPQIEHRGDVFAADFTEFEGFDFLMGGSPCTYWSIAQKNNRETEASGMGWELFSQYVRALREAKPKYFIYENNKSMSKAIRASISRTFGFEPICINSALVSAQNRQRLYWCGIRQADGTYKKADIPQPEDRGILLKDILESGVAWQDKSFAYTTRCHGATVHDTLQKHRHTMAAEAVTQSAQGGGMGAKTGLYAVPMKVGEVNGGGQGNRIYSTEGKAVAQTATSGGIGSNTGLYAIPVEFDDGIPTKAISCADGKTYDVYAVNDGLITIKGKQYPIKLVDGYYIIRKLTVRECMRLQTVPEWFCFPCSDSQAYRQLGNGWTILIISHLIKYTLTGAVKIVLNNAVCFRRNNANH